MYKFWLHQPICVSRRNRKIPIISTASEKHRNTDIVTAVVVVVFIAIAMANVIVDMAIAIVVVAAVWAQIPISL